MIVLTPRATRVSARSQVDLAGCMALRSPVAGVRRAPRRALCHVWTPRDWQGKSSRHGVREGRREGVSTGLVAIGKTWAGARLRTQTFVAEFRGRYRHAWSQPYGAARCGKTTGIGRNGLHGWLSRVLT